MLARDVAAKEKLLFRNQIRLNHLTIVVMLMNDNGSNNNNNNSTIAPPACHQKRRLCETSHGTDANELAWK